MSVFPRRGIEILAELKENNNRDWFLSAKNEIDENIVKAGTEFADSCRDFLETELKISLQSKIYRLNRDLRFSKDKTPYNSHLRFSLWSADEEQRDAVCFHFSVEPDQFLIGTGMWELGPRLASFRANAEGIEALLGPEIRLSEPELKKVPRGFSPDDLLSDHYRRKGFTAWFDRVQEPQDLPVPEAELIELLPIFVWMNELKKA